ncbi:MAG: hypothetical protein QM813_04500 [Verrucomicrobiota bacterium]
MTLLEMLVAVGIGMMVMAAVGALMFYTVRSYVALGNYNDLDQASRFALDAMSRDIRQVRNVNYCSTNLLYVNDWTLCYWWNPNPNDRRLYRYELSGSAWKSTILLEQCDYLRFGMSQRNPSNNFSFYPTTGTTTAKLLDVSWTCSREIFNKRANTESVQTAKIVIRN